MTAPGFKRSKAAPFPHKIYRGNREVGTANTKLLAEFFTASLARAEVLNALRKEGRHDLDIVMDLLLAMSDGKMKKKK